MMKQAMRFDIDVIGAIFLDRPDLADEDEIVEVLEYMLGEEAICTMSLRKAWQLCREAIHEWHGNFFNEISKDIDPDSFRGWYEYVSEHYNGLPLYKVEA